MRGGAYHSAKNWSGSDAHTLTKRIPVTQQSRDCSSSTQKSLRFRTSESSDWPRDGCATHKHIRADTWQVVYNQHNQSIDTTLSCVAAEQLTRLSLPHARRHWLFCDEVYRCSQKSGSFARAKLYDKHRIKKAKKKQSSFPSHSAHTAALISRFISLQPDTSRSCRTMNTGPVCRTVCLFTPQLTLVPNYTAWWQRHVCANNFSKVALDSAAAGNERAISNRKSNAVTTTPLNLNVNVNCNGNVSISIAHHRRRTLMR